MSVEVEVIEAEELRKLIDARWPVTVLDVRPTEERAEWAIPGSVHIDAYDQLKAGVPGALEEFSPTPGESVVTVCAGGKVSLVAAEELRGRGIVARSLAGGMKAWSLIWNVAECPLTNSDSGIVQVRRTGKGCLSYLIGSQGEAAVVDPAVDPQVYVDLATKYEWSITHVLETHIHADHLMRSRLLAEKTGAALHLPANDRVHFPFQALNDGDILDIGNATIRVLATPGLSTVSGDQILKAVRKWLVSALICCFSHFSDCSYFHGRLWSCPGIPTSPSRLTGFRCEPRSKRFAKTSGCWVSPKMNLWKRSWAGFHILLQTITRSLNSTNRDFFH